jgi:hypothetical protein
MIFSLYYSKNNPTKNTNAMTPTGFDKLSVSIQTCFLWAEGQHLCTLSQENEYKKLYIIYNFFVEVSFKGGTEDIAAIHVLYTDEDVMPYLESIHLPDGLKG